MARILRQGTQRRRRIRAGEIPLRSGRQRGSPPFASQRRTAVRGRRRALRHPVQTGGNGFRRPTSHCSVRTRRRLVPCRRACGRLAGHGAGVPPARAGSRARRTPQRRARLQNGHRHSHRPPCRPRQAAGGCVPGRPDLRHGRAQNRTLPARRTGVRRTMRRHRYWRPVCGAPGRRRRGSRRIRTPPFRSARTRMDARPPRRVAQVLRRAGADRSGVGKNDRRGGDGRGRSGADRGRLRGVRMRPSYSGFVGNTAPGRRHDTASGGVRRHSGRGRPRSAFGKPGQMPRPGDGMRPGARGGHPGLCAPAAGNGGSPGRGGRGCAPCPRRTDGTPAKPCARTLDSDAPRRRIPAIVRGRARQGGDILRGPHGLRPIRRRRFRLRPDPQGIPCACGGARRQG